MARFQREFFKNEEIECADLRATHLKTKVHPPFRSFTIVGNEDAPSRLDLYASNEPLYNDHPVAVYESVDGDLVLRPMSKEKAK